MSTDFANFIQYADEAEKREVYEQVIKDAIDEQSRKMTA